MSHKVESTTDSPEQVLAATGRQVPKEEAVKESATAKEPVKTAEDSESAEVEQDDASEEDQEQDAKEGDESKDEDKPKKKSGFQKRVDKLNKRLADQAREAEYWKEQALKAKSAQETKPDAAKEAQGNDEPKEEDYESHKDYVKALARWEYRQEKKADEEKRKATDLQSEEQKARSAYGEKVEAFRKENSDYDDVIEAVDEAGIRIPFHLESLLLQKNDPQLTYELAKDHEELKRIAKLSYGDAAFELGRKAASLGQKAQKNSETKITKAPAPIKPLGSKGVGVTKNPDEMTFQEFKKWRAANS